MAESARQLVFESFNQPITGRRPAVCVSYKLSFVENKVEEAMSNLSPSVADTVPSGSPDILNSPHVSEGPGRLASAPVPSIYVDDRGDIHRLRVGGQRINLLYSKEQVMRSGYFHPHTIHDFVVSGKVEVWKLGETDTEKTVYGPKEYFSIPPYVPHILYFLEDTTIVEFWDGGKFQCYYYHPYRKIVDIQNSLVSPWKAGRHQRLVPEDNFQDGGLDAEDENGVRTQRLGGSKSSLFWSSTLALVTGIAIGALWNQNLHSRSR